MTAKSSSIPKFYEKNRSARLDALREAADLDDADVAILKGVGGIGFDAADAMIENAVGTFSTPLGIATNFVINGVETLVPMATEESSVVAAASKGAKAARATGGFYARMGPPLVVGQIQLIGEIADDAETKIAEAKERILDAANAQSRTLSRMGRGATSISCRRVRTDGPEQLVAEIVVDTGDAMGANITNSMCEAVAPIVEELSGGRALLRILSNYSERRVATVTATFGRDAVGGSDVVRDMLSAYQLAKHDMHRAVTHNKGIMNGMTAVAFAAGQDIRAIDAAAHAYASRGGAYSSLTEWTRDADGNLVGKLETPLAVGTVGGVSRVHPAARVCTKIMRAESASDLACVIASAGLAQNYAAMHALVTTGIQAGHMRLHARNLAIAAGATLAQAADVAAQMVQEGDISEARARDILGKNAVV